MKLAELPRTIRTLRHLRPSQVAWRLRYRLRRSRKPQVPTPPGQLRAATDIPVVPHIPNRHRDDTELFLDRLEQGEFHWFHHSEHLGHDTTDWRLGSCTDHRLWTITLHYHEWALQLAEIASSSSPHAARASDLLRHYLSSWITDCPLTAPGSRDLAWNAYAIATRLDHWSRLYTTLGPEGRRDWRSLDAEFLASYWQQATHLHNNLEYDLRANHLLRDAMGLAWAGRFLDGPDAARWLATATTLGLQQAREQVLPDGGHFERSPMYHLHAMEDILTLATLIPDSKVQQELQATWQRMAEFLTWMRHPDGQIPLFNDAAHNGACHPADMLRAGSEHWQHAISASIPTDISVGLPQGSRLFDDYGMAVHHDVDWSLFFDVGPIGPDYQPGHAHADTLSIELSYRGQRLIVDPGTFHYDDSPTRAHDRSTAAHNTVCLNDSNSSEVWHIFRVGQRAASCVHGFETAQDTFTCRASHNGYDSIPGAPAHTRTLTREASGRLLIHDHIQTHKHVTARGAWHIAAPWQATQCAPTQWELHDNDSGENLRLEFLSAATLECIQKSSESHSHFGQAEPTSSLSWQTSAQVPFVVTTLLQPV